MHKNKLFSKSYRQKINLIICLFVSVILILSDSQQSFRQAKINSLNFFSFFYKPFNWIDNQMFINKKFEVVSSENLRLNLENQILKVNEIENIRLREFLNFTKRDDYSFVGADVISKGLSSNLASVIINRGEKDGIIKNLPVLSSRGVVGKIISVSKSSSEVQLISDVNFRISIKIMPDEVEGILRWVENDICEITELKKISDIEIGDIVLSSNLSIYFPPNLPIGEVVSILEKSDSSNKVVKMRLFSDLSSLNQLFVFFEGSQ
jgi:rod shape-determining protein MreC